MPRKKAEQAPVPEAKETITLTVEVDMATYDQILVTVKMCGFDSVDEWLMDAIMDKI